MFKIWNNNQAPVTAGGAEEAFLGVADAKPHPNVRRMYPGRMRGWSKRLFL